MLQGHFAKILHYNVIMAQEALYRNVLKPTKIKIKMTAVRFWAQASEGCDYWTLNVTYNIVDINVATFNLYTLYFNINFWHCFICIVFQLVYVLLCFRHNLPDRVGRGEEVSDL